MIGAGQQIDTITQRLLATDVPAAMSAYEQQLGKLEKKKAVLREQASASIEPQKPFNIMFAQAWAFLVNPWILWDKGGYDHKRLFLRLAFTDNLAYCRDNGFAGELNRKIALPFGAYKNFAKKNEMVPRGGIEPPTRGFSIRCSTN